MQSFIEFHTTWSCYVVIYTEVDCWRRREYQYHWRYYSTLSKGTPNWKILWKSIKKINLLFYYKKLKDLTKRYSDVICCTFSWESVHKVRNPYLHCFCENNQISHYRSCFRGPLYNPCNMKGKDRPGQPAI